MNGKDAKSNRSSIANIKKGRPNKFLDIGIRGRKTGWEPKKNVKKDHHGYDDPEDFFESDAEELYQETSPNGLNEEVVSSNYSIRSGHYSTLKKLPSVSYSPLSKINALKNETHTFTGSPLKQNQLIMVEEEREEEQQYEKVYRDENLKKTKNIYHDNQNISNNDYIPAKRIVHSPPRQYHDHQNEVDTVRRDNFEYIRSRKQSLPIHLQRSPAISGSSRYHQREIIPANERVKLIQKSRYSLPNKMSDFEEEDYTPQRRSQNVVLDTYESFNVVDDRKPGRIRKQQYDMSAEEEVMDSEHNNFSYSARLSNRQPSRTVQVIEEDEDYYPLYSPSRSTNEPQNSLQIPQHRLSSRNYTNEGIQERKSGDYEREDFDEYNFDYEKQPEDFYNEQIEKNQLLRNSQRQIFNEDNTTPTNKSRRPSINPSKSLNVNSYTRNPDNFLERRRSVNLSHHSRPSDLVYVNSPRIVNNSSVGRHSVPARLKNDQMRYYSDEREVNTSRRSLNSNNISPIVVLSGRRTGKDHSLKSPARSPMYRESSQIDMENDYCDIPNDDADEGDEEVVYIIPKRPSEKKFLSEKKPPPHQLQKNKNTKLMDLKAKRLNKKETVNNKLDQENVLPPNKTSTINHNEPKNEEFQKSDKTEDFSSAADEIHSGTLNENIDNLEGEVSGVEGENYEAIEESEKMYGDEEEAGIHEEQNHSEEYIEKSLPKDEPKNKLTNGKKSEEKRGRSTSSQPRKKGKEKTSYQTLKNSDLGSENANGLRKSSRNRISPIKWWNGECIEYKRIKDEFSGMIGLPKIAEVIRVEDSKDDFHHAKKKRKFIKKENGVENNLREENLIDLKLHDIKFEARNRKTGDTEPMELIISQNKIDWLETHEDFDYAKTFEVDDDYKLKNVSTGFMLMKPGSEKPNRNTKLNTLTIVVVTGKCEVTIHRTTVSVGVGTQFTIPQGNQYKLVNNGKYNCRLFWVCIGGEE
ncbi:Centromere protein C [Clydaea vesicula]|uniref:Centromere protein C n=1 Tax=Clydaea vesicula TaxID=447962 RepID=A0AAD5U5J7_9FUNG|nr:Centromere protein C [Clydaea vesicula]